MSDIWTIPITHDVEVRENLARWSVLVRAGTSEWDADLGASMQRGPTPSRFAALREELIAAGLEPELVYGRDHETTLAALRRAAALWGRADAARAFTAGLWSAPAAWRSALPGVLLADSVPEHEHVPWGASTPAVCQVCGFRAVATQTMQAWASRLVSGVPLDGDPAQYAQVLEWFGTGRPVPSEYDRWTLGALRAVLRSLPAGTRYSSAAKALAAEKVVRSVRTAVDVLEALALVGVLADPERPGLAERFSTYRERDDRPNVRVEVQAPLAWWSTDVGEHGVRTEIFEDLFGFLDIPEVSLERPRPKPAPAATATIDGGLARRVRAVTPPEPRVSSSVGSEPVAPGDVWAIRLEPGRWVTAYVHEVRERGGREFAHAEYLVGVFDDLPAIEVVSGRVQPRASGRAPTWVHSLAKTPWVRRIAQGVEAPAADEPRPESGSWLAGKGFRDLSAWHFEGGGS